VYDSDWDDSCDATLADIALPAYSITDKCVDTGLEKAGGQQSFKRASHVEIANTSDKQPPQGTPP
jgi:hypothetical protein